MFLLGPQKPSVNIMITADVFADILKCYIYLFLVMGMYVFL